MYIVHVTAEIIELCGNSPRYFTIIIVLIELRNLTLWKYIMVLCENKIRVYYPAVSCKYTWVDIIKYTGDK